MYALLLALLLAGGSGGVQNCICDPTIPDTLGEDDCGLTKLTIRQPQSPAVFLVRDRSLSKRHRWLVLPRDLRHNLEDLTPEERATFWAVAITKARSEWPGRWAVLVNGVAYRTQCQLHAHIGELLGPIDQSTGIVVSRVEDIPLPPLPGEGVFITPDGGDLRVVTGNDTDEEIVLVNGCPWGWIVIPGLPVTFNPCIEPSRNQPKW